MGEGVEGGGGVVGVLGVRESWRREMVCGPVVGFGAGGGPHWWELFCFTEYLPHW